MQRKKHEKIFLPLLSNKIRYHETNNIDNDINHSSLSKKYPAYSLTTV